MIESAAIVPLVFGILVLVASLISLKLGISVAIIEIILGAISGQFGLQPQEWMTYLAGFGGILLTFLAGTEIDTNMMKQKFKASFLIGFFSFLMPFLGVAAYTYFVAHWNIQAAFWRELPSQRPLWLWSIPYWLKLGFLNLQWAKC